MLVVLRVGRRRHRRPRQNHQLHRFGDVVGGHGVPSIQGGGRHGDAGGEELCAVALDAAAGGFARQPLHLLLPNLDILQVFTRKQDLRFQGFSGLHDARCHGGGRVLEGKCNLHCRHPVVKPRGHVSRQRDGDAVQQVLAQGPLLRVEGGDQQGAAGVADGEAFALDHVPAVRDDGEEQVRDGLVQQVDFVDIEDA